MDNPITKHSYRLLYNDMMALFHESNEGVIRILGVYFEMSRKDATRSLVIYKKFCEQAIKVNAFFNVARVLLFSLGVHIPEIKYVLSFMLRLMQASCVSFEIARRVS